MVDIKPHACITQGPTDPFYILLPVLTQPSLSQTATVRARGYLGLCMLWVVCRDRLKLKKLTHSADTPAVTDRRAGPSLTHVLLVGLWQ